MRVSLALAALLLACQSAPQLCSAQAAPADPPVKKSPAAHPGPKTAPDVIFFDGTIYTGSGMAEDKPQTVEAMAIGGDKVLGIGASAEIPRLAGPPTLA